MLLRIGLCAWIVLCASQALAQLPLGQQGPSLGPDPFLDAVTRGSFETVQQQINAGADVNKVYPDGITGLIAAAKGGYADVTDLLVKNKARLEQKDKLQNTALNWAAERGHLDVVRILLAAGADPNTLNRDGSTPLIKAAKGGYAEIVQLLVDRKADLARADYSGLTPLDWAERGRQPNVVRILKQAGAR